MYIYMYVCMSINRYSTMKNSYFFKFPKLKDNINKMGIISLHSFVKILKYRNWP